MAPKAKDAQMSGAKRKRGEEHQKEAQTTSTSGDNEWKKRPPYSIHDDGADFKVVYEGNCHCESVKWQLSREVPLGSKFCHCTTCQVQHGMFCIMRRVFVILHVLMMHAAAPFQWAAIFEKEDINFIKGHHDLEWYDPTSKKTEHHLPCKVRCKVCHSPIMDEGRNMILLFPTLLHFKSKAQREKFAPKMHIFYGQRVVDIADGLPKWSEANDKSDLIEDSPEDAKKEYEEKKKKDKAEEKKKEKTKKKNDTNGNKGKNDKKGKKDKKDDSDEEMGDGSGDEAIPSEEEDEDEEEESGE